MEDFNLSASKNEDNETAINVSVSAICNKDGKKIAYVSLTDGTRYAEGEIPACKINKNEGFSEEEIAGLELYLKSDLERLKQKASEVNIFDAFLK